MNKEFIPYEQALELKELGFDEECLAFYTMHKKLLLEVQYTQMNTYACAVPLYQQAFRWLRERIINRIQFETYYMEGHFLLLPLIYFNKYEIHVTPISTLVYPNQFGEMIPYYEFPSRRKIYSAEAKNYEEAQLYCLFKLIEIVKNK